MSQGLGLTRAIESLPKQNALLVLDYHRIGNADETLFDPGVFSATAEEFDDQVSYLKRRFHIADSEEAIAMATGKAPFRSSVLFTFDDGYLDNYTIAFPVLRSHGASGIFFLPTRYMDENRVPFWDVIAYIVKSSGKKVIRLDHPEPVTFDVGRDGIEETLKQLMRVAKRPEVTDTARFIAALEVACETASPSPHEHRRFMNWDEARQMHQGGMAIGSHTHNHEILSKLPFERQSEELRQSRRILEEQLGTTVDVFAYPDGRRQMFSQDSQRALRENGYRAAFSLYGGLNTATSIQPLDIRRWSVERPSKPRFRLQTNLAIRGMSWF